MDENELKMRRRRERLRQERLRRKKRKRAILIGCMITALLLIVLLLWALIAGIVSLVNSPGKKEVKAYLDQLYESEIEDTEKQDTAFSEWFYDTYKREVKKKLFKAAEDGDLTTPEVYEAAGESMHVLADRYRGRLKDAGTAAKHQIYLREGKRNGIAEISIGGDLCLTEDGFVIDHYDEVDENLETCISPELLDVMNQSDIFYINHEYTISDRGEPLAGKAYTFRAEPKRMNILQEMGTDIVSLANNHVFDYGADALNDTVDLLEDAGIAYVGGGRNIEEAKRPVYFIVNGIKIGFVAASNGETKNHTPQAAEDTPGILQAYDTAEYNQVIQNAAKECDYLIAYIHWGTEDSSTYNEDQQNWGREFLESGADIVVGGHPHVLQGIEYVEGKPIVYSLGDFWFNHETKFTGLLKLTVGMDGLKEMSFVPALQEDYETRYLDDGDAQKELYNFLEGLSSNVEIDDHGIITEKR